MFENSNGDAHKAKESGTRYADERSGTASASEHLYADARPESMNQSKEPTAEQSQNAKFATTDFASIAKSSFTIVDINHNGALTKDELNHALSFPAVSETDKQRRAVEIMYNRYDFLANISDQSDVTKRLGESTSGITYRGIDAVQAQLNGNRSNPLEFNRTNLAWIGGEIGATIGIGPGSLIGLASGIKASYAGESAAVRALTIGSRVAGGLTIPILAGAAIGYGVGYLLDHSYKQNGQSSDLNVLASDINR